MSLSIKEYPENNSHDWFRKQGCNRPLAAALVWIEDRRTVSSSHHRQSWSIQTSRGQSHYTFIIIMLVTLEKCIHYKEIVHECHWSTSLNEAFHLVEDHFGWSLVQASLILSSSTLFHFPWIQLLGPWNQHPGTVLYLTFPRMSI